MLETPESLRHYLGDSAQDWAISRKDIDRDMQWLGGIWDGEGCFSLVHTARVKIGVQSRLTNTSEKMIQEVKRIVDAEGLAYHLQQRAPTLGSRPVWHMSFNGMRRTARLIVAIRPYLRVKAEEADLVAEYIRSRLERPIGANYSDREIDIFTTLRQMHGYRLSKSPETIRLALAG